MNITLRVLSKPRVDQLPTIFKVLPCWNQSPISVQVAASLQEHTPCVTTFL